MTHSTERFTKSTNDYVKYRPSYPREVLKLLTDECGLTKNSVIADIGSGTGLFSQLLLEHGNTVFGIEPNEAMRIAGENYLKDYENYHSVIGTAENTTLKNECVDFVTVGTAFHWFDPEQSKIEFNRIVKKNGWIVLVWNVPDKEQSELIRDYENLNLTYGTDYKESKAQVFDKTAVKEFFEPHEMLCRSFPYTQHFDWEGFKGRLLSASYCPRPGDQNYSETIAELKKIFDRHQKNNQIEFLYSTRVYYGKAK